MPRLTSVPSVTPRPRDFVRVAGPDAEDLLERLLSNDVAALELGDAVDALLLTPKARLIAPLRVWRRAADDFLLLTEPGLGETVREQIVRARFASKAEVEAEEHRSWLVFGGGEGIRSPDYGVEAVEVLDEQPTGEPLAEEELERLRIEARTPAWGRELDERVLPAEAGLVGRAISLTKGCFPGQEPIARLHYRGHANRALRVLEIEGDQPPPYDAELGDFFERALRHRARVVRRRGTRTFGIDEVRTSVRLLVVTG